MALTKRLEHLHAAELALEEDGAVQGVEGADHAEQEHLEAAWCRREPGRRAFVTPDQAEERGKPGLFVPGSRNSNKSIFYFV